MWSIKQFRKKTSNKKKQTNLMILIIQIINHHILNQTYSIFLIKYINHAFPAFLLPILRAGLEAGPCSTFLESLIIPDTGSRPKYLT